MVMQFEEIAIFFLFVVTICFLRLDYIYNIVKCCENHVPYLSPAIKV